MIVVFHARRPRKWWLQLANIWVVMGALRPLIRPRLANGRVCLGGLGKRHPAPKNAPAGAKAPLCGAARWWLVAPLGRAVAPARCAAPLLIVTFVRRRLV